MRARTGFALTLGLGVIAGFAIARGCAPGQSPPTGTSFQKELPPERNTAPYEVTEFQSSAIPTRAQKLLIATNEGPVEVGNNTDQLQTPPPEAAALNPAAGGAFSGKRFTMRSGSKVVVEGTANIINTRWRLASSLVGGYFETGPDFLSPGVDPANPGRVDARAEPFVPVRSLKSVDADGRHYSDAMDQVVYGCLDPANNPRALILFHLHELILKSPSSNNVAPYEFQATGELVLAGVTNIVSMPVSILPLNSGALKISGSNVLNMTDFKIEPPAVALSPTELKAGNQITMSFDWIVGERPRSTAISGQ